MAEAVVQHEVARQVEDPGGHLVDLLGPVLQRVHGQADVLEDVDVDVGHGQDPAGHHRHGQGLPQRQAGHVDEEVQVGPHAQGCQQSEAEELEPLAPERCHGDERGDDWDEEGRDEHVEVGGHEGHLPRAGVPYADDVGVRVVLLDVNRDARIRRKSSAHVGEEKTQQTIQGS